MRSPAPRRSLFARFAVPVILSLALHGLLLVAIWQAPVSQEVGAADADPSQMPTENDCVLRLDDAPHSVKRSAATPKPGDDGSVIQATFEVHLVSPPIASSPSPAKLLAVGAPASGAGAPTASSGSSGDGSGKDHEPNALPVDTSARSVVYVVDRSISMGFHGALARARREVIASLRRLGPATRFQVIAYNREAEPLRINGEMGLLGADAPTIQQVASAVSALRAAGATDHGRALRRAMAFHPDLIYFLTDADDVSLEDVKIVTRSAGRRTIINTVELSGDPGASMDGPLHKLAADNGGTYRRLDPEE